MDRQQQANSEMAPDGFETWNAYWTAQGMPWRTEPEIDNARQLFLGQHLEIIPSELRGEYPFKGVKLCRADIEWLLAARANIVKSEPARAVTQIDSLEGLDLRGADLRGIDLQRLPLSRLQGGLTAATWFTADEQRRDDAAVDLRGANLSRTLLDHSTLRSAKLQGAVLRYAHLESASLRKARLADSASGTQHRMSSQNSLGKPAHQTRHTDLRNAYFDSITALNDVEFGNHRDGTALVADVRWGSANLSVLDWSQVTILGDELVAKARKDADGHTKSSSTRLAEYRVAVRANRQLASALRQQGINEVADRFAYRAHVLQRRVLFRQGRWLAALGSWVLDRIAGYGYRPLRSVVTYGVTILLFSILYWCVTNNISLTHGLFTHAITSLGMQAPPRSPDQLQAYEAIVVSMTSFHGRGFFQPAQSPGDKVAILAAVEAAVGLLLEITFIATFTQRFFAR